MLLAPLLLLTIGGPLASPCQVHANPVVIRAVGLGVVEPLDAACHRAVISSHDGATVVTPLGLAASVRAPVSPEMAQAMLDLLRQPELSAGVGCDRLYSDRALALMDTGTPIEQARFLRELYATHAKTKDHEESILIWEGQLFDELSLVLGVGTDALKSEMRLRYRR